ncbi:MAG: hypothetical protein KDJ33_18900 [Gammaproteobacteria bacterium]|nr:hypothetical protein [Gammaproteobacteria bacterium]
MPQNNSAPWRDPVHDKLWCFYTNDEGASGVSVRCKYGDTIDTMVETPTNASTPFYIEGVNNVGKAYSVVFGMSSGAPYAALLVNQSGEIPGNACHFFVWPLTASGLGTRADQVQTISDKVDGHVALSHNLTGDLDKLYASIAEWNGVTAIRGGNLALTDSVGMAGASSATILFAEHFWCLQLTDGFVAFKIDEGAPGEVNGNFGHLREWTKTNQTDAWSSEQTIEGAVSGAGAADGDFTDQNYGGLSHAGKIDVAQITSGRIYVAYIDNSDLSNGNFGVIKFNRRGNTKASGWTSISTDVIGSAAKAWGLALSCDGTDITIAYVKDNGGVPDSAIYTRKFDSASETFGDEAKLVDIRPGYEFRRLVGNWRTAIGNPFFMWSETSDDSTYDALAASAIGDAGITGDLLAQESGPDTAAITGTVQVTGTLATQETGSDAAAITGSVTITGTLAAQETGPDGFAGTGSVLVAGVLSVQESGPDIATITGSVQAPTSGGVLSVQESGPDTATITGSVAVGGALAAQESGQDTAAIAGQVHVSGVLSVQEAGPDIATIYGAGELPITGVLDAREVGSDTAAILGSVRVVGTLSVQETAQDGAAIAGTVRITGVLAVQETGSDTATISDTESDVHTFIAGNPNVWNLSPMGYVWRLPKRGGESCQ